MAEEPTLPSLPTGNHEFHPGPPHGPKRVRLQSTSPPISSDPPLFSSDDDPSAENYSGLRRRTKRRFRGPWYSQEPEDNAKGQQRGQRKLQRQFDSAVWLGSDGTEGDSDADLAKFGQMPVSPPASNQQTIVVRPASTPYRSSRKPRDTQTPEELARAQIELCLETGKGDLDLSARGLTHLSNALIKPLSTFVPVPEFTNRPTFQSLRPALKIFLSSNKLQRIPGEICKLEGLRVLSLRNNEIRELPSRIGQLKRLVELNVANNSLHYLPYEILDLFGSTSRLHSFQLHPNPFYQPDQLSSLNDYDEYKPQKYSVVAEDGTSSSSSPPSLSSVRILPQNVEIGSNPASWKVNFKFRSQVRFLGVNGTLLKGPDFPDSQPLFESPSRVELSTRDRDMKHITISCALTDDIPEPPRASRDDSNAPPLLDLAVRAYMQSPHMPDLDEWRECDHRVPEHILHLLSDAKMLRDMEAGDRLCTICKRIFIVPRTEWIEWWEIEKDRSFGRANIFPQALQVVNQRDRIERLVPLIRRGCSWKCVPKRVADGDKAPLDALT